MVDHSKCNMAWVSDDSGFTLLEMIIVLFVVSMILMIPTIQMKQSPEKVETELYVQRLASEILRAHNQCVLFNRLFTIDTPSNGRYLAIGLDGRKKYIRAPAHVTITTDRGHSRKIFDRGSGHVTNIRPINIRTSGATYSLRIQLGSGRYTIVKTN